MSEKRYNLICSYLHMHRRAHFPHQVDDNHRYYDNAFTWVVFMKIGFQRHENMTLSLDQSTRKICSEEEREEIRRSRTHSYDKQP